MLVLRRPPARTLAAWAPCPAAPLIRGPISTAHRSSLNLTVTGSQPPVSRPALEASCAVMSPATMSAAARPHPPTSSYSSLLPSHPHTAPSTHHGRSTELVNLHDGCFSKQVRGGASCDAAPPASCPCCSRTGELHVPRTDLRAELHNVEPLFAQAAR
jgi:hypothetical protein